MTPQELIEKISAATAQKMRTAPPLTYEVNRVLPDGKTKTEAISLPQAIAELSDVVKILIEQKKNEILHIEALILTIEKNRKVGERILKQNKRSNSDEDDDD